MTTERKAQQRTVESRKKLLDAAYNLFVDRGYYNTNTKEIAHHAGISIGNFYNYYQDKGDVYCVLLEAYFNDSCSAMQKLFEQLILIESRTAYRDFLSVYLRQLLDRAADVNKLFEDSVVIAKENTQVQSIISMAEERLIATIESFLKERYPNKQDNSYVRARMIYILTDQVAKDILRFEAGERREAYIQFFVDEIIRFSFDL